MTLFTLAVASLEWAALGFGVGMVRFFMQKGSGKLILRTVRLA